MLENAYSEFSMSLFKAMNIDLDKVAQVQFYLNAGLPLTE